MDDIRWFTPNRYCALPVPALRRAGLTIALEGESPAALAVGLDAPCAVAAFEFSLKHRCPLILNLADLPPWRLGRGRPDFVFEVGGRIRRIPRPFGRYPERPGYYSRIRFVTRRASEVWCPSTNSVAAVALQFGVAPHRMPFCFDSDRFAPGPTARLAEPAVVLSVSRLVPHKNHALILRAAARLSPVPSVRIIGEGPEAGPLRRLADELGVPLELAAGWTPDEELLAAYRAAAVVVCPSRFEGFGLTPMEGLAMGRPVIASDIPPHREFVTGGARLLDPDDVVAWTTAMQDILDHPPPASATRPALLDDLTIEACAQRILPRLLPFLPGRR